MSKLNLYVKFNIKIRQKFKSKIAECSAYLKPLLQLQIAILQKVFNGFCVCSFIVHYKLVFELGHLLSWNSQKSFAVSDEIMIGVDYRSSFVAIVVNLRLGYI